MKMKIFKFDKNSIRRLLYRSFDGELNPEEKTRLEQALEESKELKEDYNAIKEIRETLVQADDLQFSPAFPDKVLARWAGRQQMAAYSNLFSEYLARLFLKVVYLGGAAIVLLLIINILIGDVLSSEEILFTSDSVYETMLHLPLF